MMLYMMGALTLDTRPFNADSMKRNASADLASKPVMGGLKPSEFMGEGDDTVTLSGMLVPSKIGGLSELELAHKMRKSGLRFPLMRGDGQRLGTYAITRISEAHKDLLANGVGFTVAHSVTMKKVQPNSAGALDVISGLLSLFGAQR